MRDCEVCNEQAGDRWVTIVKESNQEIKLWVCPTHALWLAAPVGIDVTT